MVKKIDDKTKVNEEPESFDINVVDEEKNIDNTKKEKKKKYRYLFIPQFLKSLKEDKMYLISFIITITFILLFSFYRVREAEGLYSNSKDEVLVDSGTPSVDPLLNEKDDSEELDVSDYVGFYTKEVVMHSPVVLSDTCSVVDYKLVYQIKEDKSITKYFVNDCVGVVKIWSDKLSYVLNSGARYISANNINYLFSVSALREVDGDTYNLDEEITSIKEKNKLKEEEIYFWDNNVVLKANNNLSLIKNSEIVFSITDEYKNNGGDLKQLVYTVKDEKMFYYIVFSNGEAKNCYTESEIEQAGFVDGLNYKIYSIKYNSDTKKFDEPIEIIARDKSATCAVFESDLELFEK